jgi:hypothetical protein
VNGGDGWDRDLGEAPDHRHELLDQTPRGRLVATDEDLDVRARRSAM